MFSDPQFWVAIAFAIFVIAIFNPVRKILSSSLDNKIIEIKKGIEEAENLKNETQIILSEIKKRENEVEKEIKEIYSNSENKIKSLESLAKSKLSEQSLKRETLAKEKIEQMIRDVNLLIKQNISQTAIDSTLKLLEKNLNKEDKQNLIDKSIEDLGSVFKT